MALNLIMDVVYDTNRTISEITNITDVINEYLFRYVEEFLYKQSLHNRIILFVIANIKIVAHFRCEKLERLFSVP